MDTKSIEGHDSAFGHLKLFFALSRTPHGLLDMATPALASVLWLGAIPPLKVVILGLVTAFAGYTAVYALNDVIDYRVDKEKIRLGGFSDSDNDLDSAMTRHPMAQGLLSLKEGILWMVAWAALALIGAYLLNPVCVYIFISGCLLETMYCLLWRTSPNRTLVSGAVKTSGGLAAVFAVDPNPSPLFLATLFVWLFFWEIGGQNIPNDWIDMDQDKDLHARTIPIQFGPGPSSSIILGSLSLTAVLNLFLYCLVPTNFNFTYVILSLIASAYLLVIPAFRLFKTKERQHALVLFNRASYYPLALLAVVALKLSL